MDSAAPALVAAGVAVTEAGRQVPPGQSAGDEAPASPPLAGLQSAEPCAGDERASDEQATDQQATGLPPSTKPFDLPHIVDLSSVAALKAALEARRGAPLVVRAAAVERIGGLGHQLLMAAAQSWAADGQPFVIAAPSEGFRASAATLGLAFPCVPEGATP